MKTLALILVTLASQPLAKATPSTNALSFEVEARNDRGRVHCALYASAEHWLSAEVVAGQVVPIEAGRALCRFSALPPGDYAISAFHDEDGDGELDTNFLGIPSEGYCASNNARASFGPPDFADARFHHAGAVTRLRATVRY